MIVPICDPSLIQAKAGVSSVLYFRNLEQKHRENDNITCYHVIINHFGGTSVLHISVFRVFTRPYF